MEWPKSRNFRKRNRDSRTHMMHILHIVSISTHSVKCELRITSDLYFINKITRIANKNLKKTERKEVTKCEQYRKRKSADAEEDKKTKRCRENKENQLI
jgi:hypothetical protein